MFGPEASQATLAQPLPKQIPVPDLREQEKADSGFPKQELFNENATNV